LGDIGIAVEGVEAAGRMPGGARGQAVALQQDHVLPPSLGQVVEHGAADDTAADDDNSGFRLHGSITKEIYGVELAKNGLSGHWRERLIGRKRARQCVFWHRVRAFPEFAAGRFDLINRSSTS